MMSEDTALLVEFYGGPVDGLRTSMPKDVKGWKVPCGKWLAVYEWANRTMSAGRWVLEFVKYEREKCD